MVLAGCASNEPTTSNSAKIKKIEDTDICYMSYNQHLTNGYRTKSYQVECDLVPTIEIKTVKVDTLLSSTLIDGVQGRSIKNPPKLDIPEDEQPKPEVKDYANGVYYYYPTNSCYRSYNNEKWDVDCSLNRSENKG